MPLDTPVIEPPAVCVAVDVLRPDAVEIFPPASSTEVVKFLSAIRIISAFVVIFCVVTDPASDEIRLLPKDNPAALTLTLPAVLLIVAVPPLS